MLRKFLVTLLVTIVSSHVYAQEVESDLATQEQSQTISVSDNFIAEAVERAEGYGLYDVSKELYPREVALDATGMKHVKYDQIHMGIPVYGAQLIAHIAADGSVVSTTGRTLKDIDVPSIPGISQEKAIKIAKRALRGMAPWKSFRKSLRQKLRRECRAKKSHSKCKARRIRKLRKITRFRSVEDPKLYVYDAGFMFSEGANETVLVWTVRLINGSQRRVEKVFLNASTGEIISRENGIDSLNRFITDCSLRDVGICDIDEPETYSIGIGQIVEYIHGRSEGQPPRGPNLHPNPIYNGSTDVDDAYDMAPSINDYYLDRFGINGPNGQGGTGDGIALPQSITFIETHTNGGISGAICQPGGAGLGAQGPAFCAGSVTHDLMAHEYGHILTNITGLVGQGESGSVEEAFSDIMGEAFEYYMTGSNDWVVGGDSIDHVRDMANPHNIPSSFIGATFPETYTSPDFYCGPESNGGTHINLSILNKASYLMTDGGDFSGCTISGIGMAKVEQIWFQAANNYFVQTQTMGPNDDDDGFYDAFNAACASLVGNHGIIASDCEEVQKAMQAVKLDQNGGCSGDADPATPATCAAVEIPADFDDDGDVDGEDYLIWAQNYNRTDASGRADGDANDDGLVDATDYGIWRDLVSLNADLDGDLDIDKDDLEILRTNIGSQSLVGDLDNDGSVTITDCELLRDNYTIGLCPPAGVEGAPCQDTTPSLYTADGNFDGIVDSADYAVWRNNFGGTTSTGDYNGDRIVDAADYTVWRDLFGLGGCNVSAE